ncbi:hypothetical protein DRP53_01250 [candidate division WOR-3 bacterium]|uniref:Uncharacterized protein n=1 Tax=candidate division WOR-3 bacterium TaxID=2052148 RepID=A0A660SL54_UNCW3|nr:MAG: hypothetical protein DRP53_01250 [candidate division WOR-3 bacterium]
MKKSRILKELEGLAQDLSISVIYDRINGQGGYCRLKEKHYIIINSSLSLERKIEILAEGLKTFPLDRIYLKPRLREIIEGKFSRSEGR